MGYRDILHTSALKDIEQQLNIMALVGNGFDLQILKHYEQKADTSYVSFYFYEKMRGMDRSNILLKEMERLKDDGKENWSDVEACISSVSKKEQVSHIIGSLNEIREEFSGFLNYVVNSHLLSMLSSDAENNNWPLSSLGNFLDDIKNPSDFEKIHLGKTKQNRCLYNYYFINFNYTPLLDNYLFLDSKQFDPHPHSTSDTNFFFERNPHRYGTPKEDDWNFTSYSYLYTDLVHPHGYQDIPRSLLFGTNYSESHDSDEKKLAKLYWAQTALKYEHLFNETNLFIIFGSSLG